MLRFEQLRLFHSVRSCLFILGHILFQFSVSHSSIQHLLKAGRCKAINFEAVESNLKPSDLSFEGYQSVSLCPWVQYMIIQMNALCFEMDDSIDELFFESILDVSKATKFIFHACDKIPQSFVRNLFQVLTRPSTGKICDFRNGSAGLVK